MFKFLNLERRVAQYYLDFSSSPTAIFVFDLSTSEFEEHGMTHMLSSLRRWLHGWETSRLSLPKRANPILVLNKADLLKEKLKDKFPLAEAAFMREIEPLQVGESKFAYIFLISATEDEDIGLALKEALTNLLEGSLPMVDELDSPDVIGDRNGGLKQILLYKRRLKENQTPKRPWEEAREEVVSHFEFVQDGPITKSFSLTISVAERIS